MEKYYKAAKKRVKKKKAFWNHFTTWGIVCTFLFIINMMTSSTHWWIFPTLGWGVAVAINFVSAFGFFKQTDWEEKQIKDEMRKMYKNDTDREDYGELDLDEIPNSKEYASDSFDDLRKEWDERDFV